jgi:hypothetical protein
MFSMGGHKGGPYIVNISFLKSSKKGGEKMIFSGYHFRLKTQIDDLIIVKTLFK